MLNLSVFNEADNIYTFLHVTIFSFLSGMSPPKRYMSLIAKNNTGQEMTGQMKRIYSAT